VRSAFAGRCDSASMVAKDTFMVSAVEDVAQSSKVFENPTARRFVFPPLPTSSPDPLFAVAGFSATTKGMLSLASLEGSLRCAGPSLAPVSNGVGSVELRIQPTSTRQSSLLFGGLHLGATELGEKLRLSIPASLVSCLSRIAIGRLEKAK
jgi:hypothetical protein